MFRVVTTSVPGSMSSWSPSWGGGRSIVLAIADGPAEGPGLTWVNWGAPPPLDDEDRVVTVVSGARSIGGWFGEWGLPTQFNATDEFLYMWADAQKLAYSQSQGWIVSAFSFYQVCSWY